jgi:hypothetical protein
MRRRTIGIAVGALLLLAIGTFAAFQLLSHRDASNADLLATKASTCDDAFRILKLAPSVVAAARPVCLVQSLQFAGELRGSVGQAYVVDAGGVAPAQMCRVPKRWDNFPQARLALVVGSKPYRLTISPNGYSEHQPVTQNDVAGRVEVASIVDPTADWNQVSGTVAVKADGVSGNIDVQLLRDVAGAQPVHLTGNWTCGTSRTVTADPNVPCSLFYSLNELVPADVVRMKAQGCKEENLTFTGAISGHLDHAVNDHSIRPHPGIDGDNYCGAIGEQYDASLKFSIGDESFLLDLNPRTYPSVGPGRYPAAGGPFSANAFLWLGQADPTQGGLFQPDAKVFWYGSSGSFTIASDMKSGTIDETFSGALSHPSSTVQITGSWRCA